MDGSLRPSPAKFLSYIVLSGLVLFFIIQWFTDFRVGGWQDVLTAIILIELFQALLQPLFTLLARLTGLIGVVLLGLFGYATVFWITFSLLPGINNVSFWECVKSAWIYAVFIVVFQWVFLAQSDEFFIRQALGPRRRSKKSDNVNPGFIFIQMDGVSSEVMKWQLMNGNLPNIRRLIKDEGYKFERWQTQLPSTTPASQAGILFGNNDGIPAFRWYDRASGKVIAANQAAGAQLIEDRLSNGKGLLADGGVSLGNLFTGDAKENIMVMSQLESDGRSLQVIKNYTAYFSGVYGFMRALVMSVAEVAKELRQAWLQNKKHLEPRVERKLSYVMLRAATNVLLRDLQTRIALQKMQQGVNSLYVDYLDYDEIAHHAGLARPEALDALSGLDRVVGICMKAIEFIGRPYHLVLLSDHGQSQGQTFKQLNNGVSLADHLGKASTVVTGSGNVGNIWFKQYDIRAKEAEINSDYPGLIDKLLASRGVGFIIVDTPGGPVGIGKNGRLNLKTQELEGISPLAKYGDIPTGDLLRPASMKDAPDIQVYSDIDFQTGEVYAFEELVGNHGGIGGWQTDALLLYPKQLSIKKSHYKNGVIRDSTTLYKIFTEWLSQAGQRGNL